MHVPPVSSLVFVVILAVWAVYLVQHWVRRREHLATAKSVDRFSESMRVLERRREMPRPELVEAAPRAYSVSPLRPARPQVVVKRGQNSLETAKPARTRSKSKPRPRVFTAARVRGMALLVGVLALGAGATLSVTEILPWWGSAAGAGTLVVLFAGVRASVRRQRKKDTRAELARPVARAPKKRHTPKAMQEAPAHAFNAQSLAATTRRKGAAASKVERARPERRAEPVPAAAQGAPAAQAVAQGGQVVAQAEAVPVLYDLAQVEDAVRAETARADVVATVEEQAAEGTWSPVPVPPPTYTLKAKAYRAESTTSVTGSAQLPVDGLEMALEDEFEDLPQVHQVG